MGIQTVGSQGGGGGTQEQKSNALARQGSFYSLTLDEVQQQLGDLGKPLSSMNLDELLKRVWIAESNQGTGGVDCEVSQESQDGQIASNSSLRRQSSHMLTGDLSKKTVDEVWRDIQHRQRKNNLDPKTQARHSTLGEITLKEFLVKAGVVAEMPPMKKKNSGPVLGDDPIAFPQQSIPQEGQWMHYQLPSIHQFPPQQQKHQQQQNMLAVFMPAHPVQQPLPMGTNPIMEAAYPETQITMSPSPLMGALSDTQALGRNRIAPGDVIEKTVERRQKRMIKNRESAARSRARKQAYTHELENKVSRLEEENERLKRQKEVEKVLPCVPPPEPKYQLRRTSSAPF